MPTRGSRPDLLVDTSVAVALVLTDHEHHLETMKSIGRRRLGLAGHAAFETFSVLTRLPPPARRPPDEVARLLMQNFPSSRFLSSDYSEKLLSTMGRLRVSGGAVYDALVGATALEHRLKLATRDKRALATYRALEVEVEVLA
jgi:predicted nucleic acid-binding protein